MSFVFLFSEERLKAEAAEASDREPRAMQIMDVLMLKEKENSFNEHMKQLQKKMQQEREQLMTEQQNLVCLKLKVPFCTLLIFCSPINNVYQVP